MKDSWSSKLESSPGTCLRLKIIIVSRPQKLAAVRGDDTLHRVHPCLSAKWKAPRTLPRPPSRPPRHHYGIIPIRRYNEKSPFHTFRSMSRLPPLHLSSALTGGVWLSAKGRNGLDPSFTFTLTRIQGKKRKKRKRDIFLRFLTGLNIDAAVGCSGELNCCSGTSQSETSTSDGMFQE